MSSYSPKKVSLNVYFVLTLAIIIMIAEAYNSNLEYYAGDGI
jgi:hypothetical protein